MIDTVVDILTLARGGHTVDKIRKVTRVRVSSIKRICDENGVTLAERAAKAEEAERHRRMHRELAREEARLAKDAASKEPYRDERVSLTPIAFAVHVLKDKQLLRSVRGVAYVNGVQATPWNKMREANRVLKGMGLAQIKGDPSWLV